MTNAEADKPENPFARLAVQLGAVLGTTASVWVVIGEMQEVAVPDPTIPKIIGSVIGGVVATKMVSTM